MLVQISVLMLGGRIFVTNAFTLNLAILKSFFLSFLFFFFVVIHSGIYKYLYIYTCKILKRHFPNITYF